MRFQDKVAIVTGAASGMGACTAELFAREGAKVVLTDVVEEDGRAVAQRIADSGGEARFQRHDVSSDDDWQAIVAAAIDGYGRIDILVNNAGLSGSDPDILSTEVWDRMMNVNAKGTFLGLKHVVPVMQSGGGGAIVNISSISALRPRGLTMYTTTKGAVIALTQAMAVDHGRDGIRVNCIAPGPVYTPMVYAGGMSDKAREARKQASALKVEGTGWDIGNAVVFLVSDQARYITGHTLVVDGGVTLLSPERDSAG